MEVYEHGGPPNLDAQIVGLPFLKDPNKAPRLSGNPHLGFKSWSPECSPAQRVVRIQLKSYPKPESRNPKPQTLNPKP